VVNPSHLAQVNIARARAPLDDPLLADFMAQLDAVNALAESTPGFIWRLKSDSGNATDIRAFDDPRMIVNMSVWESADALFAFTYKTTHTKVMNRRKEWFEPLPGPHMVLWWIPAGTLPALDQAMARLQYLAKHGPTTSAFTFKVRFPPPTGLAVKTAAFVC
jgi:hypothetical protein